MIKLNQIKIEDEGRKVVFDYSVGNKAKKFFNLCSPYYAKYEEDVSNVPNSILVIPFLANVLPISWFAGLDAFVPEIDVDFFDSILSIKNEFQKQYPNYKLEGSLDIVEKVKNNISGNNSAMLFSGGVDAYATYIRNFNRKPDLITILGADIEIEDKEQWKNFKGFLESENLLKENTKHFVESNLRKFYTYEVELLLKNIGWWGKIQHGLSLIGVLAPLSYLKSYSDIYIASSYTKEIEIAWGSTPQIDEKISWASINIHHDGYELKRQDKVDLITSFSNKNNVNFKLRVCYSELRSGFNCSHCEKCYRTIIGIILNGENPNNYGFKVDENVYEEMFKVLELGSASHGMNYFWWELQEKAKNSSNIFVFKNKELEYLQLEEIKSGKLQKKLNDKIIHESQFFKRLQFIFRNRFKKTFEVMKKIKNATRI